VTADSLNYAPVIMGIVTIFALISWWVMPEEKWFPKERIEEVLEAPTLPPVHKDTEHE